jgi:molecular chaperone GrpE
MEKDKEKNKHIKEKDEKESERENEEKKERKEEKKENGLREKLIECEKLKEEYLKGWQRSKADFLNHKKEESERIGRLKDFIVGDLILKILEIFDHLELARKSINQDSKFSEGINQIYSQFKKFLEDYGIEEIRTDKFNPNFHEAIEGEGDKIVEVIKKGYLLKGRLLRAAKVRVAK